MKGGDQGPRRVKREKMDVLAHNREAWDGEVKRGNRWTVPVTAEEIAAARKGRWEIVLTPLRPVPREWFPALGGTEVLCLASGGGQQGPILAAAGATVTVLDQSPEQLASDRMVAEREGLAIRVVQGDMADLSLFDDESFDLIVHPVSNVYAPDVRPVWREAFRVLRPGGALLSGITNPAGYIFDWNRVEQDGTLAVRYPLPYSDLEHAPKEVLERQIREKTPVEFSHTLNDQIGGQIDAGFVIAGFYEDGSDDPDNPLDQYMKQFFAIRAVKPER
jgi:SAM-dependent methyltransferase